MNRESTCNCCLTTQVIIVMGTESFTMNSCQGDDVSTARIVQSTGAVITFVSVGHENNAADASAVSNPVESHLFSIGAHSSLPPLAVSSAIVESIIFPVSNNSYCGRQCLQSSHCLGDCGMCDSDGYCSPGTCGKVPEGTQTRNLTLTLTLILIGWAQ